MVIIFGFSIEISFKNTARCKKVCFWTPPSKISLTSWIIIRGGPKVHFFFKLVHLAMLLNEIFMLNPKMITIFPYIHFLAGFFMLFNFSDSYKKNVKS